MKKRILAVEDNRDTRTLFTHLLKRDYIIDCVPNADEAIEAVQNQHYDLLLVDINLGKGKSGEHVLHVLRGMPTYNSTPVIAVTAYAMPGDRERFFAEGFDNYVSKPFTRKQLLDTLNAAFEL